MSMIRAEYIWIDGNKPTQKLRSKTKIIEKGSEPPIWGFDGSSTNQAPGDNSDCVLNPVKVIPDPIRGGDNILVMCEVLLPDMTPHPTNTRALLVPVAEKYADFEPWFGMEQEYTFFREGRVFGFPPVRLSRSPRRLLLRYRRRRDLRATGRRRPHAGVPGMPVSHCRESTPRS
jgi:glutamine synthetase